MKNIFSVFNKICNSKTKNKPKFNLEYLEQLIVPTAPVVNSISLVNPPVIATNQSSLTWQILFSENVTGVDANDFGIYSDGTLSINPNLVVSGSGNNFLVTANQIHGDGKIGLNLIDNGTIKNSLGQTLQGSGDFISPDNLYVGKSPRALEISDLNNDGIKDLISANFSQDSISVLMGKSKGGFDQVVQINVGDGPFSVVAADLNNDQKVDLVTANGNGNDIFLLIGNGDGTFRSGGAFPCGKGPVFLRILDLNGDGNNDLVSSNYVSRSASILLGNGNGTFKTQKLIELGDGSYSIDIADINGDGNKDLISLGYAANKVKIFLGNSDLTFKAPSFLNTGAGPNGLIVEDLNNDGKIDLIVSNLISSTLNVYLGNGNGIFQAGKSFSAGDGPFSIAIHDLNNDGFKDIATANNLGGTSTILFGDGNGNFANGISIVVGANPRGIKIADINNDLNADLLIVNEGSGNISIIEGKGSGTFANQTVYPVGNGPRALWVGDLNADGVPDTATANSNDDTVTVLLSDNGASFANSKTTTAGDSPFDLKLTDLNADGINDLITANFLSDNLGVSLGNVDGSFKAANYILTGDAPISLNLADFNLDGKSDLVVANMNSDNVFVFLGKGDGTFQNQLIISCDDGPVALKISDVDQDGIPDIVVTNKNANNFEVFLGKGDGTFDFRFKANTEQSPVGLTLADFNHDGSLDLAISCATGNALNVFKGNGDGTFGNRLDLSTGNRPAAILAEDANGDGFQDLIVGNSFSNDISLFLGNGNGNFKNEKRFAAGSTPYSIGLADINGDGRQDFITANSSGNNISVLLGNGSGDFIGQTCYVDQTAPFVQFAPVSPFINHQIDTIVFVASETLFGIDASDFILKLNGDIVSLQGVQLNLNGSIGTLIGLGQVTQQPGYYELVLNRDSSGIHDVAGNNLQFSQSLNWTVDKTAPEFISNFQGFAVIVRNNVPEINIQFTENVTGVDVSDFELFLNNQSVNLSGASITGSGVNYQIKYLAQKTNSIGDYRFVLKQNPSISDLAGNLVVKHDGLSWKMPGKETALISSRTLAMNGAMEVFDTSKNSLGVFTPFPSFPGAVHLQIGDFLGNGSKWIVAAAGEGGAPHVVIVDAVTKAVVRSFFAYSPMFRGGLFIAVGDVNGDGADDLITGPNAGGGPHVKVFDGKTNRVIYETMVYSPSFTGGVSVSLADVNGDGRLDLITGTGRGGGPHVRAIDPLSGREILAFMAYQPTFTGGVNVFAGDIDGNGRAEIVTGTGSGGGPHVQVFDTLTKSSISGFMAYQSSFNGGVRVGLGDRNSDGILDIYTGPGPGGGPLINVFDGINYSLVDSFFAGALTDPFGAYIG
ncbi:MAG: FG-GAP repeat domain-containing protein [Planctomycetia bacterium]